MKIFITGEAGQLARRLNESLTAAGHTIVDSQRAASGNDQWRKVVSGHHPWPEMDVRDYNEVLQAFRDQKPDIVIHSAAVVNTDKCSHNPKTAIDVNLLGTHNVLQACRKTGAKLVYFSTTATYDPHPSTPRPFKETTPQRPPTLYGITKFAGELLVTGQQEVPWMVIRPCFVYGDPPYDHSSQLCRLAVHTALQQLWPEKAGPTLKVTLNPDSLKDYMRVEDFSAAVTKLLTLSRFPDCEIFNVSGSDPRPMGDYFRQLAHLFQQDLDMKWDPDADYMRDHLVDSRKLRFMTGWAPRIHWADGIVKLQDAAIHYVQTCFNDKTEPLYK